jgi:hypothetical protein
MGGCGSSRWGGHAKRFTVENSFELDVFLLYRRRVIGRGCESRTVRRSCNGVEVGSIGLRAGLDALTLYYTFQGESERVECVVPLATTRPHFGGCRWWFLCPLRGCGRRAGKLYLPCGARLFGCRHCYGLTYATCGKRGADRALTKTQKIRTRLGGSASLAEPFPNKPKGMWWRTYHQLRERAEEAEISSWALISVKYAKSHLTWAARGAGPIQGGEERNSGTSRTARINHHGKTIFQHL